MPNPLGAAAVSFGMVVRGSAAWRYSRNDSAATDRLKPWRSFRAFRTVAAAIRIALGPVRQGHRLGVNEEAIGEPQQHAKHVQTQHSM